MKILLASLLLAAVVRADMVQPECPMRRLTEHSFVRRAQTSALIDNGIIFLGVHDEGHLNVRGPEGQPGLFYVGLRYLRNGTQWDATAPGCLCEGWGASATDSFGNFSGFAAETFGISNMTPEPIVSDGVSAVAVVTVGTKLKVTHDYHPAPETSNLYEVEVTYENIGTESLTDIRYRRAMDWDIPPTEFSECVTINTGNSKDLEFASDNGFAPTDPLVDAGSRLFSCPNGIGCPVYDSGPSDHGAVFTFLFKDEDDDTINRSLGPGESFTFKIFYGAAANKLEADAAVTAVEAEVFSYGYASNNGCSELADGSPNVFIFGFGGVGGEKIFSSQPSESPAPSSAPSPGETLPPTPAPTSVPTMAPTSVPTYSPTMPPTSLPTYLPTMTPTSLPTYSPTRTPTSLPTYLPTKGPTEVPTEVPTEEPTDVPTEAASNVPTYLPTGVPTPTSLCTDIVIDFEEYAAGDKPFDLGFGIKIRGDGNRGRSGVMVFDTANPTGEDEDLVSTELGKIVILSEDESTTDPDDNARGGYIRFTFDPPISEVVSIDLKDFDSSGSSITGKYGDRSDFSEISVPEGGDGSEQTVMIAESNVSRLKINLAGSGGIDNLRLVFCAPE